MATDHPKNDPAPADGAHDGGVSDPTPSADLAAVVRWEESGGEVEVLDWGPPVVVSLCTCDGGQEMQRLVSSDADLVAHLADQ